MIISDHYRRGGTLGKSLFGPILLVGVLVFTGCESGNRESGAAPQGQPPKSVSNFTSDISLILKPAQLDWIGQKIFQNECAGQFQCLVHWNKAEAFPSLGIGHFIWYPKGIDEKFVESFPALIQYMKQRQLNIPEWLRELKPFDAPWSDRETFLSDIDSAEMAELREFLAGTQGVQAEFIFRRAKKSLTKIVNAAPKSQQDDVRKRIHTLSQTPGGIYAIVDYVNFKGEGLSPTEQYKGQGWGLLQVLMAMTPGFDSAGSAKANAGVGSSETSILDDFRQAAGSVLTRRADNAENPVERERWLAGWLKRIDTYREPAKMLSRSKAPR